MLRIRARGREIVAGRFREDLFYRLSVFPIDVPPLHVLVLGDNRGFSNDSRAFGPLPLESVIGRAWFSYWPPDQWGLVQ